MAAKNPSHHDDRLRQEFATTRWSIVLSAGRKSSPNSQRALASLCESYWFPLYAYVRRQVPDLNEAHDLTQAFFAEFLEKNYAGTATPQRGRFRAYLLTALKHFLLKQWEKAKTQKRGGGCKQLRLDFEDADARMPLEPAAGLTAEQFYDQQWAIALLAQIMLRLEEELGVAGKQAQFIELKGFIVGDHQATTYAQVAERLGMSEAAAKKAASRMRQRYRELLREEISQTVENPADVEDEIRNLFVVLSL